MSMTKSESKVQIAYIHGENVSHSFHHSLLRLSNNPMTSDLYTDTHVSAQSDPMSMPEARNVLMSYFLDQTDATHIWWIDTDMGFAPDTVSNLLDAEKDVIGAVCKGMMKLDKDGYGGYVTKEYITAYDLSQYTLEADENNEQTDIIAFTLKEDLDLSGALPQQVAGTGTACLLVSRRAAATVRNFYGSCWFERIAMPTGKRNVKPHIISEDLSFCYRLATVGIPIFIHPKVRTTHAKTVWLQ